MRWHHLLAAIVVGSIGFGGSAAALTIAKPDRDPVVGSREQPGLCVPAGCLQPVQMPMWPFGNRTRADAMPEEQRELLTRLLSPELSEVVSQAERQILNQALERGDRLSTEAIDQLSAMLRDKQSQQEQRLATAKAEAERKRQAELAAAEAERQRQREQAAAEAERQRQAELARAEAERQRQREQAAEAERQRQEPAQAAAAAERRRQSEQAAAAAERQRQARLAAAEAERQRQAAEAAQALAEAKREAEAAGANAASLVFYDEFPPLQPL